MRKTLTKYFLLLLPFLFTGCDIIDKIDNRELTEGHGIQSTFPFEFTIDAPETLYWKSAANFYLRLDNENQVDGQLFHISWELRDKEGKLFFKSREVHEFDITKGKETIQYVPLDKGEYKITFFCTNGNEKYDVEQIVNFTVINRPFNASVTADRDTFYQSENEPIHLQITVEEPDWVTYQYSYVSAQENKLMTVSRTPIEEHKRYDVIENNEFLLLFDPTGKTGKHTLFFHFFDTQGQEVVEEITFNVKAINIGVSLDYISETDKEIFYTQKSNLQFTLTPAFKDTSKVHYTAKFTLQNATGLIEVGGNTYKKDESFPIEPGSLHFAFVPTTDFYKNTTAGVGLVVSDNYGNSEDISVNIKLRIIDFELTLENLSGEIFFNEKAQMKAELTPEFLSTPSTSYTATYTVQGGKGEIEVEGKAYRNGDQFPILPGGHDFTYKPTEYGGGNHLIKWSIEDEYGTRHEKSKVIQIKQRKFAFTATTEQPTLYLGEKELRGKINCSLQVEGNSQGMSYFLQAQSNGSGVFYYKGKKYHNNERIAVHSGAFSLEYKPSARGSGSHTITLTALDNTGQTKTQTVSFKIYQKPQVKKGSVRTWYYKDHQTRGFIEKNQYHHHYLIQFDEIIEPGVEINQITLIFYEKSGKIAKDFTKNWKDMSEKDGFKEFFWHQRQSRHRFPCNGLRFDLFIIDSKQQKQKVYSGIFTDEKNDNQ